MFENDQLRVLRITIAPGEKTPVHEHPAVVAVWLTDAKNRVTVGGTTTETPHKAGEVSWLAPTKHVVENVTTTTNEVIVVELKGKAAAK